MKIINANKGKSLFFVEKNMKLEIEKKVNLDDYVKFMMEVFAELVIAKYNIKKEKEKEYIRRNILN